MNRSPLRLYLQDLPSSSMIQLFSSPCTCLGLLLLLPRLAQVLILRLLYNDSKMDLFQVLTVYDHAKEYFKLLKL